ncbi:MAG TPA: Gfo/Idh/MocA family oxidoreductase [Sedimentisphaerales bacterium]|nr:Gfo/Idh/MocA family oxidoreductase [Sedimentisphaerales bacterium]
MLKGGVIGFGRMGVTHYSILNTHPDVQFVAVCDSSNFVLKNLKRYTRLELYTDYQKMLNEQEMDFVIVATPTASHVEVVKAAVQRGLHMFVEKPFSLTAEEGKALVAMLEGRNLVNQVGYFLRFNEVFRAVRKLVADHVIGDVVHYKNEMYGCTVLRPSKSSWRGKKEMGGGCILDFASHCIDFSNHVFGMAERVSGSILRRVYSTDVEDAVYAALEHRNGTSGNVMVNWSDASFRRPYNRIEILGTKGKIVADRQEYRLYLHEVDNNNGFEKGWNIHYLPELDKGVRFAVRGSEFTNQLDHFIECIKQNKTETMCTFADALQTDLVIEKIKTDFATRSN